jgi:hypothetical protein
MTEGLEVPASRCVDSGSEHSRFRAIVPAILRSCNGHAMHPLMMYDLIQADGVDGAVESLVLPDDS